MAYFEKLHIFRAITQDKILDLPDKMQREVLAQVPYIFEKNDNLDEYKGYLNDEECSNATVEIDKLILEKREELSRLRAEAKTPQQMGELKSPNETYEDGSQFIELLKERKQLEQRGDELDALIDERTEKLGYNKKENYAKEITDKKLIRMLDERDKIWERRQAIYKSFEDAISEYPMGTKFQCGDFVIQRKRAYTDETGDRNLVFLN